MPQVRRSLVLLCALALAGCGLGRDDAPAPELQEVTSAQLAAMPLPQAALGPLADGLGREPESGPVDNSMAAKSSLDPLDTAVSMRGKGRLTGHKLNFVAPRGLASLRKGKGVFLVGTEVELLEDTVYAAHYLAGAVDDLVGNEGRAVDGVEIRRVSSFPVPGVAHEAHGLTSTATVADVRMHMTVVVFRRGRLVASVGIVRGDKQDMRERIAELAAKLDVRIQAVLAGEIAPDEVEAAATAPKEKAAFAGRKELSALTLAAEDVGPLAVVSGRGRQKGDGFVSFYRTFDDVIVGRSHLRRLHAHTLLYRTPAEAELAFRSLGAKAGRQAWADGVLQAVSEGTGWEPDGIRVRALEEPGKGLVGLVATFGIAGRKYQVATVAVRSGRMVQAVSGMCFARSLHPRDMIPVARRAEARLGAAA